jgi:3-(3-hydroxy-phenyl)propionate hydroxylase
MKQSTTQYEDVVIVGAGPVGLAAAAEFANLGIQPVVLEASNSFSDGSKAICWSQRTLEILNRSGSAKKMLEKGVTWKQGRVYRGHREVYNFDLQAEPDFQMPAFINLQQYYFEEFLERHIETLKFNDIRRSHEVISVDLQKDSTVLLTVKTPEGEYYIESQYVIAADGVKSLLRNKLGLKLKGQKFEEKFLITDIHVEKSFPMERRFWFEPAFHQGQSALLHVQPDNILRIDLQLDSDADPKIESNPDRVKHRIEKMLGEGVNFDLEWISVYTFSCRRMDEFTHGPIFFAGDSAHVVSPFGARGGNGGIQDVDNLSWKISAVLKGYAPKTLLDSYDRERIPAADENILNSARSTNFMTPKNKASEEFRDAVFMLSEEMPFARQLINSGRLSSPHFYKDSPLNSIDDPSFEAKGPRPGELSIDTSLFAGDDAIWLLTELGTEFCLLSFVDEALFLSDKIRHLRELACSRKPKIKIVFVSDREINNKNGALILSDNNNTCFTKWAAKPGSVYLIRPDQYIAARWKDSPAGREINYAVEKAMGH